MSLILTLEHAYAAGIRELKIIGTFVEAQALPVMEKVESAAPTVEAITGLVCPALVNIERTADAVLAKCIVAVEDAAKAAAGGFVNVQLDAALVEDIKAIAPAVKASAPAVPPAATT
jgi:hypothetical protein